MFRRRPGVGPRPSLLSRASRSMERTRAQRGSALLASPRKAGVRPTSSIHGHGPLRLPYVDLRRSVFGDEQQLGVEVRAFEFKKSRKVLLCLIVYRISLSFYMSLVDSAKRLSPDVPQRRLSVLRFTCAPGTKGTVAIPSTRIRRGLRQGLSSDHRKASTRLGANTSPLNAAL